MNHSQAKRFAVSMILKHVARELIDITRSNFLPELELEDRRKIEGCLRDIHTTLEAQSLKSADFEEIGFVAAWLKTED